jgi:hypothetical protein
MHFPIDDALCFLMLVALLTLGGAALVLRRFARRMALPAWLAASVIGSFTGGMLTACSFSACASYVPPLPELTGAGLSAGQTPLALAAGGWLKGQAPGWEELRGRVVVLDVWADW